ncbi:hypothetical protein H6F50_09035 [Coleofasciculus sp. FACHB-712]|nr:hypothetical protein [Coleofasciculus sp. FACHB-712]MBD1942497.1 hypothetical protein [Coleofasciculus sp. FACHB-712]
MKTSLFKDNQAVMMAPAMMWSKSVPFKLRSSYTTCTHQAHHLIQV